MGVLVNVVEVKNWVGGRMLIIKKVLGMLFLVELGGEFIDIDYFFVCGLVEELELNFIDLLVMDESLGV